VKDGLAVPLLQTYTRGYQKPVSKPTKAPSRATTRLHHYPPIPPLPSPTRRPHNPKSQAQRTPPQHSTNRDQQNKLLSSATSSIKLPTIPQLMNTTRTDLLLQYSAPTPSSPLRQRDHPIGASVTSLLNRPTKWESHHHNNIYRLQLWNSNTSHDGAPHPCKPLHQCNTPTPSDPTSPCNQTSLINPTNLYSPTNLYNPTNPSHQTTHYTPYKLPPPQPYPPLPQFPSSTRRPTS
jgi:hypothetical protein